MATAPNHGAILAGDGAAHPLGFVQSADPTTIGAYRPWCDITAAGSGHFLLKIRNLADGGWLTLPFATQTALDAVEDAAIAADAALDLRVDALEAASGGGAAINDQTGTSYTFVLGDANDYVRFTNGSAVAATVPPNSSVAFPVGTKISIEQAGAGVVTIAPGSGVTVNSRGSVYDTAGQYAVATLVKVATDTWTLTGDLD